MYIRVNRLKSVLQIGAAIHGSSQVALNRVQAINSSDSSSRVQAMADDRERVVNTLSTRCEDGPNAE